MYEERQYCVYVMTNKFNRVLYTGVTSDLLRRILEHKKRINPGFTTKYNPSKLVYYEVTTDAYGAIIRGKEIKGWVRRKKISLIKSMNSKWRDLSRDLFNMSC